ncbi:putative indole-diterpene biosynthesis protein [Rosellinia necatrix]|uniref:Putative indole-diterpene biosynthesis protein n=1 Tax=Rosellinia necatrix TaxID=77044 RepID=A0A1W2TM31_ROSNE|nr:putative indole-diterpene biosynthesis protein [Rosellinia necatrix]
MATATSRPPATSGLGFMQALSPRVYLLRPSRENVTREHSAEDPALIIILGWMNAADGPLAKYARQHQALFPTSAILLITCTFAGMTIPWLGLREARIAATTARAILEQDEEAQKSRPNSDAAASQPRLLIHAFSNAGSTMLYHLYAAYAATATSSSSSPSSTGVKGATVLPLHTTIFDSTPAAFTYQTLVRGILDGAPSAMRFAIVPIAYLYVALIWVVVTVLRVPDHIGDLAPRAHNDPARVREACRVYIYGPADRITPAKGVELHANEAEARGFRVRREVFDGSGHVAHARKHADRYWRIVGQTWKEARL